MKVLKAILAMHEEHEKMQLLHMNEKNLVKFGDFYLTNVGYDMAYKYAYDHDLVISIVHKDDMKYDWSLFNMGFTETKHLLYDNIQDKDYDQSTDKHFNTTMRILYHLVEEVSKGTFGNKILIHCLAGVSRSSALTLWIMAHIRRDMKAQELFDFMLSEINHLACPNPSILKWIAFNDERVKSLREFTQLTRRE